MGKNVGLVNTSYSTSINPVVSRPLTTSAKCTLQDFSSQSQSQLQTFVQTQQRTQRRKRSDSSQRSRNQTKRRQSDSQPVTLQTPSVVHSVFPLLDNKLSISCIQTTSRESDSHHSSSVTISPPIYSSTSTNSILCQQPQQRIKSSASSQRSRNQIKRRKSDSQPVTLKNPSVVHSVFSSLDNKLSISCIQTTSQESNSQHSSCVPIFVPSKKQSPSNSMLCQQPVSSPNMSSRNTVFQSKNYSIDCKNSLSKSRKQRNSSYTIKQKSQDITIASSFQTSFQSSFQQFVLQKSSCVPQQIRNKTKQDQSGSPSESLEISSVINPVSPLSDNQLQIYCTQITSQESDSHHSPCAPISPPSKKRSSSNSILCQQPVSSPNMSSRNIFQSKNSSIDCKDSLTKTNPQQNSSFNIKQKTQDITIGPSLPTSFQASFQEFLKKSSYAPYHIRNKTKQDQSVSLSAPLETSSVINPASPLSNNQLLISCSQITSQESDSQHSSLVPISPPSKKRRSSNSILYDAPVSSPNISPQETHIVQSQNSCVEFKDFLTESSIPQKGSIISPSTQLLQYISNNNELTNEYDIIIDKSLYIDKPIDQIKHIYLGDDFSDLKFD